ncbi:MAG: redox-sensing transcriptional repressor Rex [Halanaerobiales bacterium]
MAQLPVPTIRRLVEYYRILKDMKRKEKGDKIVISTDLAARTGITPAQVRKDLSYLGGMGFKGVGYDIEILLKHLTDVLGFNRESRVIIIGAGNLGRALCCYDEFAELGIKVEGIFDNDLTKIGNQVNGFTVRGMQQIEKFIDTHNISLAIIVVPADEAQKVADRLKETTLEAIWNFAPVFLDLPSRIKIKREDLSSGLGSLIYHLHN